MKGLIIKDYKMMRPLLKNYALFYLLYTVICFMNKDPSMLITLATIIGGMVPYSTLAYDEQSNWDSFVATMPLGRSSYVKGKYLFSLLLTIAICIINVPIIAYTEHLANSNEMLQTIVIYTAVAFFISLLFSAINIPITLKFGTKNARIYLFIFIALLVGIPLLLFGILGNNMDIDTFISAIHPELILLTFMVASIIIVFISMKISINIFDKKEF